MAFNFQQLFTGVPATIEKLPIQEPLQQAGINELFQQGLKNYNPDIQEKYATEQFAKRVPGIAERLNMLSGGQQRGQAANYELGGLSRDLQSQLTGMSYQHGLNALKLGLTPQYEYMYRGEQPGLLEEGARGLATSAAQALPGLAQKGAQYLFGGETGQPSPAQQLGQGLASGAVQALGSQPAGPAPMAPQVGGQDVGQLARAAAALKAAGPGAAQAALPSAVQALKQAGQAAPGSASLQPAAQAVSALQKATPFLDAAAAVAKYGIYGGSAAIVAKGLYEMISEKLKDKYGFQPTPLPANWTEMTGPQRSDYVTARQIATPTGQVTHDEIRYLEEQLGIKPNDKLSWEERYKIAQARKGGK